MSEQMFLVRWRGRQAGPYTRSVIEEKLRSKELSLFHEVFLGGRWILMKEFLAQERAAAAASTEPMSIRMTESSSLEHENLLDLPAEPMAPTLGGVASVSTDPLAPQSMGAMSDPAAASYAGLRVPTYFILAILSAMFCCLPLGLLAVWFAAQVEGRQNAGNVTGALEASAAAKNWCIVTVVFALSFWVLGALSYLVFVLALGRWH